jgi:glycosyltransferase involved in cell wall biosynthesis
MSCPVLHVCASARIAGAENSLLQLLGAVDRDAWPPVVAVPGDGPLQQAVEALGVPVVRAPTARLRRTPNPAALVGMAARDSASVVALARAIRARRAGIVHPAGLSALAVAGPAARLTGARCVLHMRDLRFPALAARVMFGMADAVIAVSRAVAREVRPLMPEGASVHVVPNGLDADAFARQARPGALREELALGRDTPLVGVAGQLVPWKGYRPFLDAFALVRRAVPAARAVLAGADLFGEHAALVASIHRRAHLPDLAGAVHLLGHRTDMASVLSDVDVVCVPSEAEPFGRVALEAMAVGRPVVGYAAGGLPEVVDHGRTGLLVAPGQGRLLAQALADLLSDLERRRAMGLAAYEAVRQKFDVAAHARAVEAVYESVTGG